jgi:hypothetical protein
MSNFDEGFMLDSLGSSLEYREQIDNVHRHCEERSDEAIQSSFVASGLLRFARNDDPAYFLA